MGTRSKFGQAIRNVLTAEAVVQVYNTLTNGNRRQRRAALSQWRAHERAVKRTVRTPAPIPMPARYNGTRCRVTTESGAA